VEILAMRMLFSLGFVALLITVTRAWSSVRRLMTYRSAVARLALAAQFIAVNWGVYIWGVNAHHVVETSLGYFINPLITVLLGVFLLSERLRPAQWLAVAVAAFAIIVITVDYGRPPWIALVLAVSFAAYGWLKKSVDAGAMASLFVETTVQVLPAALIVSFLQDRQQLVFGHHSAATTGLLIGTGAVTAVPLLLFAGGTRRLPLSMMGLLQYLTPVLQFAVGVGVRHEAIPRAQVIGFMLVWLALVILSIDGVVNRQRPVGGPTVRRGAISSAKA
jgi:chloramphenicol-sensitive protein RarD